MRARNEAKPYPITWSGFMVSSNPRRGKSSEFVPEHDLAVFFAETPHRTVAVTLHPNGVSGFFWEKMEGSNPMESLTALIMKTTHNGYLSQPGTCKVFSADRSMKGFYDFSSVAITWQRAEEYIDVLVDEEMGDDVLYSSWQAGHHERLKIQSKHTWPGWKEQMVPLNAALVEGIFRDSLDEKLVSVGDALDEACATD